MFTATQLVLLAEIWSLATGRGLASLSSELFNDGKWFLRLRRGKWPSQRNAEIASRYFLENWPPNVEWPETVPDLRAIQRAKRGAA
jgi:hypothetical protein